MFNYIFEKDKNVLIWSEFNGLEQIAPVLPANKFLPDWWKKMGKYNDSKNFKDKGTIKNCPAIEQLFDMGFIIPTWTDLLLSLNKDSNGITIESSDNRFKITSHPSEQFLHHASESIKKEYCAVVKLITPWRIKTPKGYGLFQFNPPYHFNQYFHVTEGFTWTDIHHELNQQLLIRTEPVLKEKQILIKRGTPLAWYIPYKRKVNSLKLKTIKNCEKTKLWDEVSSLNYTTKFRNGYKINQKNVNKCPFNYL